MSDVRLVGTSPEDGSLVPVAVTPAGLLKTQVGTIEEIPNNVTIDGDLTVTGKINGEEGGGGLPSPIGDDGEVLTVVDGSAEWAAPSGAPGPPGPEGPPGGAFPLPPDPYEGAFLGWLNGGLAWVGVPPVPIPEDVFGPITNWDPSGVLTVKAPIPSSIGNGVYLTQVGPEGKPTRSDKSWNVSEEWSSPTGGFVAGDLGSAGYDSKQAFLGNAADGTGIWYGGVGQWSSFTSGPLFAMASSVDIWVHMNKTGVLKVNDQEVDLTPYTDGDFQRVTVDVSGEGFASVSFLYPMGLVGIVVNGVELVDSSVGALEARVNSVISETEMVVATTDGGSFSVGDYLKVPSQKVAPWVLRSEAHPGA